MPNEIPVYEISREELEKLCNGRRLDVADGEIQLSKQAIEAVDL